MEQSLEREYAQLLLEVTVVYCPDESARALKSAIV